MWIKVAWSLGIAAIVGIGTVFGFFSDLGVKRPWSTPDEVRIVETAVRSEIKKVVDRVTGEMTVAQQERRRNELRNLQQDKRWLDSDLGRNLTTQDNFSARGRPIPPTLRTRGLKLQRQIETIEKQIEERQRGTIR